MGLVMGALFASKFRPKFVLFWIFLNFLPKAKFFIIKIKNWVGNE